jgi:transposase
MDIITLLAVDLAKNIFQIHGVNAKGRKIINKPIKRKDFFSFVIQQKPKIVAMEACGSSNYWGNRFRNEGIEVRIIPAQFVKPFVKTNKSDQADAEAIAAAASFAGCHFVPLKGIWHQDMQSLHKERSLMVKGRTALCNQIRAHLYERGIVTRIGRKSIIAAATENLCSEELTPMSRMMLNRFLKQYEDQNLVIEEIESQIMLMAKENNDSERLQKIPGIGLITATAIAAAVPDKSHFKNGRHFSAWIGLVPRHSGTGGKIKIGGISKRGNPELRKLLVQGACSVMRWASKKNDPISRWTAELQRRRGTNKARVALANKTARMAFKVLCHGEEYRIAA